MSTVNKKSVGLLGYGEIGGAIGKLCKNAGFKIYIKTKSKDEISGKKVDYLHVSIPEKNSEEFIKIVSEVIFSSNPKLVIINSSTTPGVTRKIFKKTQVPIVHSPVIGLHPHLYKSIKYFFPKIVGPVDEVSKKLAIKHLKDLGLKVEVYDSSEESEAAKLLDLIYYAWNIIYCKWVKELSQELKLNFDQIYTKHNIIYNKGYGKLLPNVVRPIFYPGKGPIGGHCTIPDTVLFEKFYPSRFTKFILNENESYKDEVRDVEVERKVFVETQRDIIAKQIKKG